tara:strand:+ start:21 stop:206 length:186 start_codon:yes stop_codon:yes gene_type:complete
LCALLLEYREMLVETRQAVGALFPLAQSAVVGAGGTLEQPKVVQKPMPSIPDYLKLERRER